MVMLASCRCCDLLVHPVDDVTFVSNNKTSTKLNLLGKDTFVHAGIDEILTNASRLNDLGHEEEVCGSMKKK